jgi:hypothetical protein
MHEALRMQSGQRASDRVEPDGQHLQRHRARLRLEAGPTRGLPRADEVPLLLADRDQGPQRRVHRPPDRGRGAHQPAPLPLVGEQLRPQPPEIDLYPGIAVERPVLDAPGPLPQRRAQLPAPAQRPARRRRRDHDPVDPKPPAPRRDGGSAVTTSRAACAAGAITSCAMR